MRLDISLIYCIPTFGMDNRWSYAILSQWQYLRQTYKHRHVSIAFGQRQKMTLSHRHNTFASHWNDFQLFYDIDWIKCRQIRQLTQQQLLARRSSRSRTQFECHRVWWAHRTDAVFLWPIVAARICPNSVHFVQLEILSSPHKCPFHWLDANALPAIY